MTSYGINSELKCHNQINPEQARAEFRAATSKDGGNGVKDFMDSMGLGGWVEQVSSRIHLFDCHSSCQQEYLAKPV